MQRQQPALSKMKGMKKNDNNILSLRIKQIEFPNPRHRNAKQEQSICERASELRREASLFVTQEANISPDLVTGMSRSVTINNTNVTLVTLSDGQILSRYCQAESIHWLPRRLSTETSWSAPHRVLEWAALSMLSVFSLAMIDQMPRLRFSINLSRVPSPDLGCFLSHSETLSMAYPWADVCMPCLCARLSQHLI